MLINLREKKNINKLPEHSAFWISRIFKIKLSQYLSLASRAQKPINANLRLKINQAVYFSTPKCCSTQIFGRTLHEKTSILKNKNKQKKFSPKRWKRETKVYANPGLS